MRNDKNDEGNRQSIRSTLRIPFWTLVQSEAPKKNNGRLEVVRLPISAGLPPGGRAALLTLFNKLRLIRLTLH